MAHLENSKNARWMKLIAGYTRNVNCILFLPISMDIIDLICAFYDKIFDFTGNVEIKQMSKLTFAQSGSAICKSHDGNFIYIFGGDNSTLVRHSKLKCCYRFNLMTNEYKYVCDMPNELSNATALQAPNGTFVITGLWGEIWIYDPNNNVWKTIENPFRGESGGRSCFDKNGILHIVGGSKQRQHMTFNSQTQEWKLLNITPFSIMNGALTCGSDGHLYYFGGEEYAFSSDQMYIFDINNNKWKLGEISLPIATTLFGYCNTKMQFIIFGGLDFDSLTCSNSIYVYNFKSQEWFKQSIELPSKMSKSSVCLVDNEIHLFGGYQFNCAYPDQIFDYHCVIGPF